MLARLSAGFLVGVLVWAGFLPMQVSALDRPAALYVGYPMEGLEPVVLVDPISQKWIPPSRDFRTA
ncbi:MAG: hypothetical protein AB7I41_04640, partial [Candidatus Sericytochromatia bacterium]